MKALDLIEIIEEIQTDICKDYCKYTNGAYSEAQKDYACQNCPFGRCYAPMSYVEYDRSECEYKEKCKATNCIESNCLKQPTIGGWQCR